MANVWGYWDCTYCGTKHIRGDNKVCPNCGRSVDKDVHYYLDKDNLVTVEKEKENKEADWICDFCDTQNKASDTVCRNCGSSRYDAKHDYFHRTDKPASLSPQGSDEDDDTQYEYSAEPRAPLTSKAKKLITLFAGLVVLLTAIGIWLGHSVEVTTNVSGFEWEYTIHTEQFKQCHESDWYVPSGGTLTRTAEEIHHYDHILDHYETRSRQVSHQECVGYDTEYRDLGNGQFESYSVPVYETVYETEYYDEPIYVDIPVYRTKYYYDIDRWVNYDDLVTSGSNHDPYWYKARPATSVASPVYGDVRESGTEEEYTVLLANGDRNTVSSSEWFNSSIGDTITYETSWIYARKLQRGQK